MTPIAEDLIWISLALAGAAAQGAGLVLSAGRGPFEGREKRIAAVWGLGFAVAILARAIPRFRDPELPLLWFETPAAALAFAAAILAVPLLVRLLRRAA